MEKIDEKIIIEHDPNISGVDYENQPPFIDNDAYELFHVTAERDTLQAENRLLIAQLAELKFKGKQLPFPYCLDFM